MTTFTSLIATLDSSTSTQDKVKSLVKSFHDKTDHELKYWIYVLTGGKIKKCFSSKEIRLWTQELLHMPAWLFEESYHFTGDLAETIAHLTTAKQNRLAHALPLSTWIEELEQLSQKDASLRKAYFNHFVSTFDFYSIFTFIKINLGGFRIGVSKGLIIKSLAIHLNSTEDKIAQLLTGNWFLNLDLQSFSFESYIQKKNAYTPFPFQLSYAFQDFEIPNTKEAWSNWSIEYKWDGIRCQLLSTDENIMLWSRGGEVLTECFPELSQPIIPHIPTGTVLDGEILIWHENKEIPESFQTLQTRINKLKPDKKLLDQYPACFMVYDMLQFEGIDLRENTLLIRRMWLLQWYQKVTIKNFKLSENWSISTLEELEQCRSQSESKGAEGLMIKNINQPYLSGRKRNSWYKYKIDPKTVDAVLLYAQAGHGRRSGLYTDFTFALWDGDTLVPFAKAYSGLTDLELKEINNFIKKNTKERFGPVRSVVPELVFEIAFEGIHLSNRHKSGVAVRFPRIIRWRKDKSINNADSLETLKKLM